MARPRVLSDEQVLDRIASMLDSASASWTLAGAAAAAGQHPATLIKRFGSRHGVLLALSRRWIVSIPTGPTTAEPYGELQAWAASLSEGQASPAHLLARIDMLVEDLRDGELRALLHTGWDRHTAYLAALVEPAQHAGQLSHVVPAATIAHLLLDAAHGGLLRAAVTPHTDAADPGRGVRSLLEALA